MEGQIGVELLQLNELRRTIKYVFVYLFCLGTMAK